MSDDLVTTACPLCGGPDRTPVWQHPGGVINAVCDTCGHVFLARRASQAAIDAIYASYQQAYPRDFLIDPDNPVRRSARERWHQARPHLPDVPRRVLEIGCGYGFFLDALPCDTLRCGIEPSVTQSDFARQDLGLDGVRCQTLKAALAEGVWSKGFFDLIGSFHVIEHLPHPALLFEAAQDMLTQNGILFLACPELRSVGHNVIELEYLASSLHLQTFSAERIISLAATHGFRTLTHYEERNQTPFPGSSHAFLFQRKPTTLDTTPQAPLDPGVAAAIAGAWHAEMAARCDRLQKDVAALHTAGHRIAVFGAGVHTQGLFHAAGLDPALIEGIIDDSVDKQGQLLSGIPIRSLDATLAADACDVILVSTLASENRLLQNLPRRLPSHVRLIGLYRDIFGPPFATEPTVNAPQ